MTSVNSCCKCPSISVIFPPICGQNLQYFLHLFFLFSACGSLELSDKCSGLNNRSHQSNVSSKFICQSRRQIKTVHFLRLPHHTPRGEWPLLKSLTAPLQHSRWITLAVVCMLGYPKFIKKLQNSVAQSYKWLLSIKIEK